jgi:hypothetical protein
MVIIFSEIIFTGKRKPWKFSDFRFSQQWAFWDTASCSLVEIDRNFTRSCCLHHQGHPGQAVVPYPPNASLTLSSPQSPPPPIHRSGQGSTWSGCSRSSTCLFTLGLSPLWWMLQAPLNAVNFYKTVIFIVEAVARSYLSNRSHILKSIKLSQFKVTLCSGGGKGEFHCNQVNKTQYKWYASDIFFPNHKLQQFEFWKWEWHQLHSVWIFLQAIWRQFLNRNCY